MRIYCGRQAFLDLLMKFQRGRKREIQGLLEFKPVSNFTYRNRIQSLLKGRFLRSERLMTSDERTTSHAAIELGLLRQNHTGPGSKIKNRSMSGPVPANRDRVSGPGTDTQNL
ncbi:hypothetical protein RND71_010064 [Anisodus tanguticus]|uniref:Uncharacterized protein n=1 Tax=Anisodus tanguticus TaxID=243964 RepID=A0AAE1SH29_9SOLA|nr:hypothetical protein RND71_010064 [Anisodus tanguticus]